jgi:16S rRNA (guanine527-N7)-methyltransferase
MMTLTDSQISNPLRPYGVAPSIDLVRRIRTYTQLLLKWNRTISLTTVTDIEQMLRFHFGESLFALSMLPVEKSRLADVGSGAGFPGIPLAMAAPKLTVTLIEANAKKYAFLNEVIRELELRNVTALHARMEDIRAPRRDLNLDIVTARALGKFDDLLRWAQGELTPEGRIALWLGSGDAKKISSHYSGWKWNPPVPIPDSERRCILVGNPIR